MLAKWVYIIILIAAMSGNIACSTHEASAEFIPDTNLMKLAQEFDRQYFPAFILSLEAIKSQNEKILFEYIKPEALTFLNPDGYTPVSQIDNGIYPLYYRKTSNIPPYRVTFPVTWNDTAGHDHTWQLYFNSLNWLKSYINSGNNDSLYAGFKVINDWILAHTDYPDHDELFAFNDHATSYRLEIMVQAYKVLKNKRLIQPDLEKNLLLSILGHLFITVSLEKYNSYHNHGIIMDKSLIRALMDFPEFLLRREFSKVAFARIFEMYRYSYTAEGVHKEHSPCYHCQFTLALDSIITFAQKLSVKVPDDIMRTRELSADFASLLAINGYYPKIGDCAGLKISACKGQEAQGYFRVFPQSGWVSVYDKQEQTRVILQSDFYSKTHYQQDETSFILNVAGNDLIIDPGLFSYTPGTAFNSYMKSARAHNLLLVDNEEFDPQVKNTNLSGITRYLINNSNDGSVDGIVEMTHPHYLRMGVEIYRQLAFTGHDYIVVKDLAFSEDVHEFSQLFHLSPGAIIIEKENEIIVTWPDHPYGMKISSNAESHEIVEGQKEPVQGWHFPEFNKAEPCKVLILKRKGKGIIVQTHIRVFSGKEYIRKTGKEEKDADELFRKLERLERTKLAHVPAPEKWRPERK
jgi:hypothetical protein